MISEVFLSVQIDYVHTVYNIRLILYPYVKLHLQCCCNTADTTVVICRFVVYCYKLNIKLIDSLISYTQSSLIELGS